jgi:hypothetical protein
MEGSILQVSQLIKKIRPFHEAQNLVAIFATACK